MRPRPQSARPGRAGRRRLACRRRGQGGAVGRRRAPAPRCPGAPPRDRLGGSEVGVSVGDGAADLPSGLRDRGRAAARGVQRARRPGGPGRPLAGGDDDVPRVRRRRAPRAPPPGQGPSPRAPAGRRVLVAARVHLRGSGQPSDRDPPRCGPHSGPTSIGRSGSRRGTRCSASRVSLLPGDVAWSNGSVSIPRREETGGKRQDSRHRSVVCRHFWRGRPPAIRLSL